VGHLPYTDEASRPAARILLGRTHSRSSNAQARRKSPRFFGEDSRRFAIDRDRHRLFLFRPVVGVVGGGIDDQRRTVVPNGAADGHSVREIDVAPAERQDLPERRQRTLQLPARLAASPEQQDATCIVRSPRHQAAGAYGGSRALSISARRGAERSLFDSIGSRIGQGMSKSGSFQQTARLAFGQ
jgi:hypothetical protein